MKRCVKHLSVSEQHYKMRNQLQNTRHQKLDNVNKYEDEEQSRELINIGLVVTISATFGRSFEI